MVSLLAGAAFSAVSVPLADAVAALALASLDLRLSVMYQPSPLKTMLAGKMTRLMGARTMILWMAVPVQMT